MTEKKFKFTRTAIDALPFTKGGNDRAEYRDTELNGLTLRVGKTTKTYYLIKRDPNARGKGGAEKIRLGNTLKLTPEEARKEAAARLSSDDGMSQAKRSGAAKTVEELAELFKKKHVEKRLKPRSQRDYLRQLDKFIVPWWGTLDPRKLTRAEIRARFEERSDDAPFQANKMLVTLSSMMTFAIKRDIIEVNPCDKIEPNPSTPRDRVLDDNEIRIVLAGLNEVEPVKRHYLWLVMLLGQRRSETALMDWKQLSRREGVWVIPKENTKNGLVHSVPLPPLAQAHIDALRFHTGKAPTCFYSWETRHNRDPGPLDPQYLTLFLRRLRTRLWPKMPRFTLHDWRRTAATNIAELVNDRRKVKLVLNHVDTSDVTGIYDLHTYDPVKLECLTLWEQRLRGLIPADVIARSLEKI